LNKVQTRHGGIGCVWANPHQGDELSLLRVNRNTPAPGARYPLVAAGLNAGADRIEYESNIAGD